MNKIKLISTRTFFLTSFAICLSIGYLSSLLWIWYTEGPITTSLFNNIDEGVYLSIPYFKANHWSIEGFYKEEQITLPLLESLSSYPSNLLDYIVGTFANILGLFPTELGLILDFFCLPITFLLAYSLFKILGFLEFTSIFSAFIFVTYPWIFSPNRIAGYLPTINSFVATSDINLEYAVFPNLPVYRSLYTQVSIIGFLLAITALAQYLKKREDKAIYRVGFYSSLCFYLYIFSGISAFVLSILAILLFTYSTQKRIAVLSDIGRFLIGFFPLGIVAMLWMIIGKTDSIPRYPELREYWYLPTEFIIYLCVIISLLFLKIPLQIKFFLKFIFVLLLAELITMNLQPILGRAVISPYHFPEFFLHPLFSAACVSMLMDWIQKRFFYNRVIKAGFIGFFIFFVCADVTIRSQNVLSEHRILASQNELAKFLYNNLPANSVFAMNTFKKPFDPSFPDPILSSATPVNVAAASQRSLLFNNWSPGSFYVDGVNRIQREFLLGWILSGEWKRLWNSPETIELPGDFFSLTSTQVQLFRRFEQRKLHPQDVKLSVCDALRINTIDVIIEDSIYSLNNPDIEEYITPIWSSLDNKYKAYRFNREIFIKDFCANIPVKK